LIILNEFLEINPYKLAKFFKIPLWDALDKKLFIKEYVKENLRGVKNGS